MKYLSTEAWSRARRFLKTEARPLDRALFEYRFEGAAAEGVIAELALFQNDDGGFGHALEPDLRTLTSSALATGIGLRILVEIGSSGELAQRAVEYLLATFDQQDRVWRVAPHDTNAFPHAPWWHDDAGSLADTFDDFQIIPRAEIVGLLYRYRALVDGDWLQAVTEETVTAIETMKVEQFGGGGDTLHYALGLMETRDLPGQYKERLLPRLRSITEAIVSRDPEAWGSYCAAPLKVVSSPQWAVAGLIWDDLQAHLDYQLEHQTPEGTWEPNWTWGDFYPEDWQQAREEWRGQLTLRTLTILRNFGRIEEYA